MRPVVALLLILAMAVGSLGSYPIMYFRIVYGSVDMVYETQESTFQNVIFNYTTHEVFCFKFDKDTDAIADVFISSESLSGSCSIAQYSWHNIYADRETVVATGPDGDLSMTIVSAPPPTPGPAPFPSYPNYYFRIVYGSVDMVYETQDITGEYAVVIFDYSAHEVFCFLYQGSTSTRAIVEIYSESFSGLCGGKSTRPTIFAGLETVVGSGPDGNISMEIVTAPPPTPGPAPFPSYGSNVYVRIVYGSVAGVFEFHNFDYQYVSLGGETNETFCFRVGKYSDVARVIIFTNSLSGSCLGQLEWYTIFTAWETVVATGPEGEMSMQIVTAPTPAPPTPAPPTPAPPTPAPPTPAPTPAPPTPAPPTAIPTASPTASPTAPPTASPPTATPTAIPTETPAQPGSNMGVRIVYGSVDMVFETQDTTEQHVVLNYTTHEVLCFFFNKKTADIAEVGIFSESFSGSCTGTWSGWVQIYDWTTVVGNGTDGEISMTIVSAPATAHPQTAAPTTPSPGSDDKLEIILIVMSATIVVILLVIAIMMYKSRHPPGPPNTPVVDEDPIQTGLLPES